MTEALTLEDWRRLHAATPLVRSARYLAALLALSIPDSPLNSRFTPDFSALPVVGILVVSVGASWITWRYTRFRVAGPDFLLDSGALFRRSRRVPLARLEAIDVVRPLLARAMGLAELRIEVAGGGESDAKLAYLTEPEAQRLRGELLALVAEARGETDTPTTSVAASAAGALTDPVAVSPIEETVITRTDTGVLLAASMLSGPVPRFVVIGLIPLAVAAMGGRAEVVLPWLLPTAIGTVTQTWGAFTRDFGTTVAVANDALRVRRGLLETRAQTVPRRRVQGVVLREPMLWRLFGWTRVDVTVAGYGTGGDEKQPRTLVPVAGLDASTAVVDCVIPRRDWAQSLSPAPRRARWRAPIEAARLAFGLSDADGVDTERVVVSRRGRFGQRHDIVPVARAQSVRLRQGPLQRMLRVATIDIDLAPGPVQCRGLHRDEDEARSDVDVIATTMRAARAPH